MNPAQKQEHYKNPDCKTNFHSCFRSPTNAGDYHGYKQVRIYENLLKAKLNQNLLPHRVVLTGNTHYPKTNNLPVKPQPSLNLRIPGLPKNIISEKKILNFLTIISFHSTSRPQI
jgi:hypothetical protein